jgi:gliding motility-associated-like protein
MLYVHEPGEYWVVVRNQTCPATDTVLLKECSELWIPNAFTPDDNGVNDVFLPKGVEIVKYEMLIFNRWGEHLFTSDVLEVGWDGVYNGEKAKSDVYYYMIRYTGQGRPGSDKEQVRYGPFTLVR